MRWTRDAAGDRGRRLLPGGGAAPSRGGGAGRDGGAAGLGAPPVDAEVLNALRRLTLAGKLSATDAAPMITAWEALSLRRFPLTGLVRRIWELRHNLTSYDAAYVALAEGLGCPVVTLDRRLAAAPGVRAPVHVVPAVSLPGHPPG